MGRVEGKVVAITGAARGQGRSHAVRLAEEGADIVAIDLCENIDIVEYPLATAEDLEETVRLVEKTGRRVVAKQADVRDYAALRTALTEGVRELGALDVVIANAGISPVGAGRPVAAFTETVDVNLSGMLNTVHAALPHLADGGSIIVIGSAAGLITHYGPLGAMGPGGMGYAFAKTTLAAYVNWFATVLAPSGTRINAVHPTNVDTDMLQNEAMYKVFRPDLEHPKREDAEPVFPMVQAMPIPYVQPIDVSHAVTFLASDESRYVTGTQLRVDGGAVVNAGK
ncbi:SDR family mycofactocin-dependent oxidoreductase [Nocardia tenerifensis]|uniref:SDR family mycofactocin-dependent oxidoreductase n=1 Tax=Nocardia tenerifensis TaxID=228006 RepID=A0A318KAW5_9NOCA|nr:mycofactocin-coupled SDR family oxidoreductase [Nocardia tenerifensis]PXX71488.1 SDR family mycofactocin-dependent oxidoreductase [Nocardia tenerifensis]